MEAKENLQYSTRSRPAPLSIKSEIPEIIHLIEEWYRRKLNNFNIFHSNKQLHTDTSANSIYSSFTDALLPLFMIVAISCLPYAASRRIIVQHPFPMQPGHDWGRHSHVTHDAGQLNGTLGLVVFVVQRASLFVYDHHLWSCRPNTWSRQAASKFRNVHFILCVVLTLSVPNDALSSV